MLTGFFVAIRFSPPVFSSLESSDTKAWGQASSTQLSLAYTAGFDHTKAIPGICKDSSPSQDRFPPGQPWKSCNGWIMTAETKAQLWSYVIAKISSVKRIKTLEGSPPSRAQLPFIVCWQDRYAAAWSVHQQKLLLSGGTAVSIKTQLQDNRVTVNNL